MATVVEVAGSTPQRPGARLLVREDGSCIGTVGGGCVEGEVRTEALRVLTGGLEPGLFEFRLAHEPDEHDVMICGGRMRVFVDLWEPERESS